MDVVRKACDFEVRRNKKLTTCRQPVPNDESTYLTFGTTRYAMDLCEEHQQLLAEELEPYLSVAHDTQKRLGTQVRKAIRGRGGKTFTAADVREWLQEQGREISNTGRIPGDLIREFEEAHR